MRISDWSSDVCSSDLLAEAFTGGQRRLHRGIGLDVAADALGNREHRGVVGRVGNTETGLNPLGGFVEVGVGGPEGRQRDERTNVGIDGISHGLTPVLGSIELCPLLRTFGLTQIAVQTSITKKSEKRHE